MYDLIYLDNRADYNRAQLELAEVFPDASFEDGSDFIHHDRFSVEIDVSTENYRLQIFDLGLALHSLNFQLWIREEPAQVKDMIEKWQSNNGMKSTNDSGAQEDDLENED